MTQTYDAAAERRSSGDGRAFGFVSGSAAEESGEAGSQTGAADSVVGGRDAPDVSGPDPNLFLAPGTDVHLMGGVGGKQRSVAEIRPVRTGPFADDAAGTFIW